MAHRKLPEQWSKTENIQWAAGSPGTRMIIPDRELPPVRSELLPLFARQAEPDSAARREEEVI